MSPQTGPDLVGAGYPISKPLTALLGANSNAVEPNVPIKTNMDWFPPVSWTDRSGQASAAQTLLSVAVPVTPGDVISKVTYLVGASAMSSPNHSWAALYTGTGSAPGTAGATPTLIGQTPDATGSAALKAAASALSFSFSTPVTITSIHAPYGYIYVTFCTLTSLNGNSPSFVSATVASPTYSWFTNGPNFLAATHDVASTQGSAAPATMGTATAVANPPFVFLS